jgi:Domain of unknown function (DUF4258)
VLHPKPANWGARMGQPQYANETNVLRAIARDKRCRFIWTKHALEEVGKDGRTTSDVEHSLMNGQVVLQEQKKDRLWRSIGKDIDGDRIQVVVAVYEEEITIKIITTF